MPPAEHLATECHQFAVQREIFVIFRTVSVLMGVDTGLTTKLPRKNYSKCSVF